MAVINQPVQWELEESKKYEDISLGKEIPPALAGFANLKEMVLIQQVEDKEAWWSRNMYKVQDGRGQSLFRILEDKSNHPIVRAICSTARPFKLLVVDNAANCILELERPVACCCPMMCPFQRHAIIVRTQDGEVIGQVQHGSRENCRSWCDPSEYYVVIDHEGNILYKVQGESCYPCEVFDAAPFNIVENGMRIGQIAHQWRGSFGCCSCCVSGENDKAVISFPQELPVQSKALLLATLVLTHFNYFEVL